MAPFMVTQPHDLTIAGNQSATFTVVAGGSADLSYQWYFNTNTPVPNATNSSLTLLNVQAMKLGTNRPTSAQISNSCALIFE